ncbi:uncharacterized protein [Lolium perenne]|uniref:uncharacterized protein n=1 Tax=Lolium perenne TaxID=4522 RepID=UPI0021F5B245|nr:uncharacterized protein LOC127328597 [Lolium perenne]
MEHLARDLAPLTRVYHLMAKGMSFKVTVTLRARRVEKWIKYVKRDYLDNMTIKCICRADEVSQALKEFLQDGFIRFRGAAIGKDVEMLNTLNPTINHIPSLYDLANSLIVTNLEKKKRKKYKKKDATQEKEDDELIFGWANVPPSFEQVRYAALDTRLGFKMARSYWRLAGYNSHVGRLNI